SIGKERRMSADSTRRFDDSTVGQLRFMSLSLRTFRRLIASVFRRNAKPILALNLNPPSKLAHHSNDHRTPNLHENENSRFRTPGRASGHGPDKPTGGGRFQAVVAESARQAVSPGQL